MKTLEELGISPAPWSFADDGMGGCDISCSGASYGEDCEGDDIIAQGVQKKDARIMAAAPKLYKRLAFAVEQYKCQTRQCNNCPNRKCCWIVDATAALAEAAGEEAKCNT